MLVGDSRSEFAPTVSLRLLFAVWLTTRSGTDPQVRTLAVNVALPRRQRGSKTAERGLSRRILSPTRKRAMNPFHVGFARFLRALGHVDVVWSGTSQSGPLDHPTSLIQTCETTGGLRKVRLLAVLVLLFAAVSVVAPGAYLMGTASSGNSKGGVSRRFMRA